MNPDRDKISNYFGHNYFYDEPQTISSCKISARTDSSNNPTKLNINRGADLHLFLNLLVGADRRTDEIHDYTRSAYLEELPSLSYSANLSGVDADALLITQLTTQYLLLQTLPIIV